MELGEICLFAWGFRSCNWNESPLLQKQFQGFVFLCPKYTSILLSSLLPIWPVQVDYGNICTYMWIPGGKILYEFTLNCVWFSPSKVLAALSCFEYHVKHQSNDQRKMDIWCSLISNELIISMKSRHYHAEVIYYTVLLTKTFSCTFLLTLRSKELKIMLLSENTSAPLELYGCLNSLTMVTCTYTSM